MSSFTSSTNTDTFYKLVIDDAMKNLREVFLNEGIDEQVIQEFKENWEQRVKNSGVLQRTPEMDFPTHRQSVQTSVNTEGTHGGSHGNMHLQQQQQQHQRSKQQHYTQQQQQSIQHIQKHRVQAEQNTNPVSVIRSLDTSTSIVRPLPPAPAPLVVQTSSTGPIPQVLQYTNFPVLYQMPSQPFPGMLPISLPGLHVPVIANTTVNLAADPGQKEGDKGNKKAASSQLDGAPPYIDDVAVEKQSQFKAVGKGDKEHQSVLPPKAVADMEEGSWTLDGTGGMSSDYRIRQLDGPHDSSSEDEEEEESDDDDQDGENQATKGDDDDDPLDSNDDDDTDDEEDGISDIVICQFDRVTRSHKTKWKFVLKNGVIKIRNRDYVFHKVTGEADW